MKILIVEDDTLLLQGLILAAQTEGYACDGVTTARMAEQSLEAGHYSLVVLDLGLPDEDGLHFLARIRQKKYTLPVLILTARDTLTDKIAGLDVGADDYLVKPFSFQELEARIKALLRRTGAEPAVPLLSCGDLTLDPSSHRAIRGKVVIDLTVKEYRLLEYLIQNQGTAQSRLTLLKNVWDKNFDTNTNVVDVYVNYLRSKIDKDFDHKLIRTVVGVGYMMEA